MPDTKNSVVIVALPSEDDTVWDVSSEKKPHLTLLFLGETDFDGRSESVVSYVEHAAKSSLHRFGLSVDRRGVLGEDDADVLFFEKSYGCREVSEFRAHLLKNDAISTAYQSADQFPEWLPHLTLGYPEAPAKKKPEYPIRWVNFDRIAVWFGDSEGPEFRLEDQFLSEVAMGDTTAGLSAAEKVLSHYGIKGQKWGVRRTQAQLDAASEDFKRTLSSRSKPSSALSNQEMQELITRMNLEKQYSQLLASSAVSKQSQSRLSRGAKYATSLVAETANTEVRRVVKGAAAIAVENKLQSKSVTGKQFAEQVGKRIVPKKK